MGGRQGRGSASTECAGICLALLAFVQCALAATTYIVGGAAGWDLNVNYGAWSANKTFKVGDTLVFKYTPGLHSVLEVSEANLKACNLTSFLKGYQTGDDSVVLAQATTHYFICGVPGHCTQGMAVTIPVSEATVIPSAPSPAPKVSPVPKASPAPSPKKSPPSPAPASTSTPPSTATPPSSPSPSPSESQPSPSSPSNSPTASSPSTTPPSPATLSPPPVSPVPSSSTTPPPQAPSPPKNAASTLHSGSLALSSALLLGGFLLIFH